MAQAQTYCNPAVVRNNFSDGETVYYSSVSAIPLDWRSFIFDTSLCDTDTDIAIMDIDASPPAGCDLLLTLIVNVISGNQQVTITYPELNEIPSSVSFC